MFSIRFICSFMLISAYQCSVIRVKDDESAPEGLYKEDDKVLVLTTQIFSENVFNRPYAVEVEFYNSFCGYCRAFAPTWVEYAKDLHPWRDVVKVAAFDCANEANTDLCREYEIMHYPSLRYFSPFTKEQPGNWGVDVVHDVMGVGHPHLMALLLNETNKPSSWPPLSPVAHEKLQDLHKSLPSSLQYLFLLYEPDLNSTVAQESTLDVFALKVAQVRQVVSPSVAAGLGLTMQRSLYVFDAKTQTVETVPVDEISRKAVTLAVYKYLATKSVTLPQESTETVQKAASTSAAPENEVTRHGSELLDHAKHNVGVVHQADLESALRFSVFHELVQFNEMNDERKNAIQRYVAVLHKYSPLGMNGQSFLADLSQYISNTKTFTGKELSEQIRVLEEKHKPIFSSKHFVGCKGSTENKRGYSCGLWTLFHYLTVQAANSGTSSRPAEVLEAIHGFVKHFFGCSDCSEHFQEMAERRKLSEVISPNDAVLWLWSAHNEVNQRLAGDETEDPAFPKMQFPRVEVCPECRQVNGDWNENEVLRFLRQVNSPINVSRFGVDDESILPEAFEKLQQDNQQANTAFSETDVRMGMLTYACCILIIAIAMKMFLQRGYRKKIYTHDFLGKV